jgi:uncharacterized Zn finger protein
MIILERNAPCPSCGGKLATDFSVPIKPSLPPYVPVNCEKCGEHFTMSGFPDNAESE